MAECCETGAPISDKSDEIVALVGPPNSGKTTLFNWLTGRRQRVVNYPGSTVDLAVGRALATLAQGADSIDFVDTPGTYSLFAKSQDEEVTALTLFGGRYPIRKVVVVIDSTHISRQVHLVRQLQEAGFAIVVALTMCDLHQKEGSVLDFATLERELGAPVVPINGVLGGGVKDLVARVKALPSPTTPIRSLEPWPLPKLQKVFGEGETLAKKVAKKELNVFASTRGLDRILLHPIFGIVIFIGVMFLLFTSIYWLAQPIMNGVDWAFSMLGVGAKALLGKGPFSDFVGDGIIAGVGAVSVFVPQIFILFFGISLLEDTGYLARAATLADRPLSLVGLNGKAFVPLLSGFACAVPAIMAARSINSKKERWLATFIIPFMTCSARLPVYALLLGFLFWNKAWLAGAWLAALYFGGLLTGLVAAGLLSRVVKVKTPSFFLLELPLYRRPKLFVVLRNSFRRTKAYVNKTAPIILVLSMSIWVLTNFPNIRNHDPGARLASSWASSTGRYLEPIFRPMGGDWRVGVGLISAFAARETFVSSMAVLFNATQVKSADEDSLRASLIDRMRDARLPNGEPVFTLASVAALLVFFMLALQCLSTTSVAFREMQSARFAIVQLVSMNVLAYLAACGTYWLLR